MSEWEHTLWGVLLIAGFLVGLTTLLWGLWIFLS